jgi:hypothetical protein
MQTATPPGTISTPESTPSSMTPQSRITVREVLGVCGFCLLVFLFYLSTLNYPIQRCDDIYYVLGAKSIAAGLGYLDISAPGMPYLTKYAPLPSLTLAPFVGMVGENWRLLRIVHMAWRLLGVLPLYPLLRQRVNHRGALLLLALFLFNPFTLVSITLQGNGPFGTTLLFTLAYLLDIRLPKRPTTATLLMIVAVLALSFYTHRSNIAVIIGATAYLAFRYRRPRAAVAVFVAVAALASPWMYRSYVHTGHVLSKEYEQEIVGRNNLEPSATALSSIGNAIANVRTVPHAIGHGLWPWSQGSGGQFWPGLAQLGLSWTQPVTLGLVFLLVAIGWFAERKRGYPEWQFPLQLGMLLFFFVELQYLSMFVPFLYFYLWRGTLITTDFIRTRLPRFPLLAPKQRRVWALLGFWLIFLPIIGKDMKVYWGGIIPGLQNRDRRWGWVEGQVPDGETVYWLGLPNYAWASWRWFDSRRQAFGVDIPDVEKALQDSASPIHYLAVPQDNVLCARLQSEGWEQVYLETDVPQPPPQVLEMLTPAQRAYLSQLPPPQILWHRSAR